MVEMYRYELKPTQMSLQHTSLMDFIFQALRNVIVSDNAECPPNIVAGMALKHLMGHGMA